MSRPVIGISGSLKNYSGIPRAGVNAAYAHAVMRAGAVPMVLTPVIGPDVATDAIASLSGLLLTGGPDIDPRWYHTPPSAALGTVDSSRDAFELALFQAARASRMPVLAICRGAQLVNVGLGGTLWQDLPSERPGGVAHEPPLARNSRSHPVQIQEGSYLHRVLDTSQLVTNSIHHQAIRDLAPGLIPVAWSQDGVIEAAEGSPEAGWLLAVQWHPEEFHQEPEAPDQRIFAAFAEAAGTFRRPEISSGSRSNQ